MAQSSVFLRRALQADALFSGASAVLLTLGSTALASVLNLPQALLFESGLFLVAYAAFVGWLSSRTAVPPILIWAVIAGNAIWALASVGLIAAGPITPNALGYAALIAQAIAVGVFAELQFIGLRKTALAASA